MRDDDEFRVDGFAFRHKRCGIKVYKARHGVSDLAILFNDFQESRVKISGSVVDNNKDALKCQPGRGDGARGSVAAEGFVRE